MEGSQRVVDPQAHRRVDVLLRGHALGDGVERQVDEPGDGTGDDHARHVTDDADVLAERLEEHDIVIKPTPAALEMLAEAVA